MNQGDIECSKQRNTYFKSQQLLHTLFLAKKYNEKYQFEGVSLKRAWNKMSTY